MSEISPISSGDTRDIKGSGTPITSEQVVIEKNEDLRSGFSNTTTKGDCEPIDESTWRKSDESTLPGFKDALIKGHVPGQIRNGRPTFFCDRRRVEPTIRSHMTLGV